MKLVVEPAAAGAVAAVLNEQFREMAGTSVRRAYGISAQQQVAL